MRLRGYPRMSVYYYFFTLGIYSRGRFKNWWKSLKGYDIQFVQSGTGRLSCSRTALKRCTSTETRWCKWLVFLVSTEIEEILLPIWFRSRIADALKTPRVSTAIGSNMWRPTMHAYFTSLRVAANSAAASASRAASVTYDSARGQDTVTSQHNDLPLWHGTSVRPSGLFPSDGNSPMRFLVTGTPAEAKLRAIKSLMAWCLADLPGTLLHTKLWSPRASTSELLWHWCGVQRSKPNLKPTTTLAASSSSLNPHDAIGRGNSQSPLRWEEAAKRMPDYYDYYHYYINHRINVVDRPMNWRRDAVIWIVYRSASILG